MMSHPRKATSAKRLPLLSLALASLALAGCGGSGGSNPTQSAELQIRWAERWRVVNGPSSALSASITVEDAGKDGNDLSRIVDRRDNPDPYTEAYVLGEAKEGPHALTVRFYAGANATGDLVATAMGVLNDDGTTTVTTSQTIQTVTVAPDQVFFAGEMKDLIYTARDAEGALVAVSPGSARLDEVSGFDLFSFYGEAVSGIARGFAEVRATIDGVASEPTTIKINADPNGQTTTIRFDDRPGVPPTAGTEVLEASRLVDQYRESRGISFSSGGGYASIVQLGTEAAPSGDNGIGGSTSDDKVSYGRANPLVFTFFDPLATQEKGLTRTFSLTTDKVGKPGNFTRLEAYDAAGTLIGSDEKEDLGNVTLTVFFDTARIHRVVFLGSPNDNDGVAVDDVTFRPVVPPHVP